MASAGRSNPLALAVLACLFERPMHPYEVAQTLRQRAKQESVRLNYGSLYAVVESLERRGQIRARETVREGRRPERTIYEITEAGSREFNDWLTALLAVPVKEYPQFQAGLSFLTGLAPDEALGALKGRADQLQFRLAGTRSMLAELRAAGHPRLFGLEDEYQLALDEAELEWVRRLVKDIEGRSLEGLDMWHGFYESTRPASDSPRSPPDQPEADA